MTHRLPRLALLALTASLLALPAAAQLKGTLGPAQRAPGANPIGLTAAQQSKLQALQKQGRAEVMAVQNSLGTPKEKQAKLQAIQKKYDDRMKAVFTPQQRARMEALARERNARIQKVMDVQKSLTKAQRTKMQDIQNKYRARAVAVVKDAKLKDSAKRQRLMALQAAQSREVMAVLTPKQRASLGLK